MPRQETPFSELCEHPGPAGRVPVPQVGNQNAILYSAAARRWERDWRARLAAQMAVVRQQGTMPLIGSSR